MVARMVAWMVAWMVARMVAWMVDWMVAWISLEEFGWVVDGQTEEQEILVGWLYD